MLSLLNGGKRRRTARARFCQECKRETIEVGILCEQCRKRLTAEALERAALRHESVKN